MLEYPALLETSLREHPLYPPHPRRIGWMGMTALAMGDSNQSLFLLGTLFAGHDSTALPLLIVGLLLSWTAAFGWTELIVMFPNRVGGTGIGIQPEDKRRIFREFEQFDGSYNR